MTNPMKPKDALGELVKEWRDEAAEWKKRFGRRTNSVQVCADQLEKTLEGKVVMEEADFAWLMSGAKDVPMTEKSKEKFSELMIKYGQSSPPKDQTMTEAVINSMEALKKIEDQTEKEKS